MINHRYSDSGNQNLIMDECWPSCNGKGWINVTLFKPLVMRKHLKASLALPVVFLFSFFLSCHKEDSNYKMIRIQTPILKSKSEILTQINSKPTATITTPGKIYLYEKYIFLNDVDKGIHVIDNSNPAKPIRVAFLNIPGNQDIAVKGNTLYADMYGDLLALDISDPRNARLTSTVKNFFTFRSYVNGYLLSEDQVIVGWREKDTLVAKDYGMYPMPNCANCEIFALASAAKSNNGVAGSMAKMVLLKDYLYAITEPHSLGVVDVSNAPSPENQAPINAGFDLETIYPFGDKLFLGSQVGMFMYDVQNPRVPSFIGKFEHGRACDPVVTDGNYAYITLRGGGTCGGASNELDIVDVKNLSNPQMVRSYPMTGPQGLSKDGNLLFVCDGSSGLKVFDATEPANIKQLHSISVKDPYDVIASDGHALVVAKSGLYQYSYSGGQSLKMLSFIPTE